MYAFINIQGCRDMHDTFSIPVPPMVGSSTAQSSSCLSAGSCIVPLSIN